MKSRLFVVAAIIVAFVAGTKFEPKKELRQREKSPSFTIQGNDRVQGYDVVTSINTSVDARRLELEQPVDGYCVVLCPDASEQFLIQVPEGVDVQHSSNNNGVTFSKNQKVVLVLMNQRFSNSGEYEWYLGGAANAGDGK